MLVTHRYSTVLILLGFSSMACDGDGGIPTEPAGNPAFLVAPKAPSNIAAAAVAYDAVRVSWSDNSTNESGFQVYRSTTGSTGTFSLRSTRLADATSFRDSGLTPQKSYCYKVRAFRTQDGTRSYSAFSNTACATTPASPKPAAPSGTVARPVSSTAVKATWTDKSNNEDGFRVQRSTDVGATWTTAGTVGPNLTAFRDNGRTTERAVCYRVIAFNEHGNSAASNTDCTTPPAKPTNLAASAASQAGINLTWADNSKAEDGYQVQRSTDGTTFSTIANLPANTTSYSDAGATSTTTTYSYRVRARKDGGFSDFSNFASATTGPQAPAAPSGTTAKPSSTFIEVRWIDNSTNEAGFRVERSSDGGANWTTAFSTGPDWTYGYDAGRTGDQEVCYRVVAFGTKDSGPSNIDCTTPPLAPTNLVATSINDVWVEIELTWTDNSSVEDGYEVQASIDDGFGGGDWVYADRLPANSTRYVMTTYPWGPWRVVAMKDGGYSDFSNEVPFPQ